MEDPVGLDGAENFKRGHFVEWIDGWPVIDKQAMHHLAVTAAVPPPHPWNPEPIRDDFDAETLGFEWTQLAVPIPGVLTLHERPGFLRLYGQPGFDAQGSPTGSGQAPR